MTDDLFGMDIFLPLAKVDLDQRIIWARALVSQPDRANEIADYPASKAAFQKWAAETSAASMGKSLGNVRVMHQQKVGGRVFDIKYNDDAETIDVGINVDDDHTWGLCKVGAYTGLSVGGKYAKKWQDPVNPRLTRYAPDLRELSIVDRPCQPGATFTMLKADGTEVEQEFAKVGGPALYADLMKAARDGRAGRDGDGDGRVNEDGDDAPDTRTRRGYVDRRHADEGYRAQTTQVIQEHRGEFVGAASAAAIGGAIGASAPYTVGGESAVGRGIRRGIGAAGAKVGDVGGRISAMTVNALRAGVRRGLPGKWKARLKDVNEAAVAATGARAGRATAEGAVKASNWAQDKVASLATRALGSRAKASAVLGVKGALTAGLALGPAGAWVGRNFYDTWFPRRAEKADGPTSFDDLMKRDLLPAELLPMMKGGWIDHQWPLAKGDVEDELEDLAKKDGRAGRDGDGDGKLNEKGGEGHLLTEAEVRDAKLRREAEAENNQPGIQARPPKATLKGMRSPRNNKLQLGRAIDPGNYVKAPKKGFIDARELAVKFPRHLTPPTEDEIKSIERGSEVKVATGGERFWIKVHGVENGKIFGVVDNHLYQTGEHELKFKDRVTVEPRHIYGVWNKPKKKEATPVTKFDGPFTYGDLLKFDESKIKRDESGRFTFKSGAAAVGGAAVAAGAAVGAVTYMTTSRLKAMAAGVKPGPKPNPTPGATAAAGTLAGDAKAMRGISRKAGKIPAASRLRAVQRAAIRGAEGFLARRGKPMVAGPISSIATASRAKGAIGLALKAGKAVFSATPLSTKIVAGIGILSAAQQIISQGRKPHFKIDPDSGQFGLTYTDTKGNERWVVGYDTGADDAIQMPGQHVDRLKAGGTVGGSISPLHRLKSAADVKTAVRARISGGEYDNHPDSKALDISALQHNPWLSADEIGEHSVAIEFGKNRIPQAPDEIWRHFTTQTLKPRQGKTLEDKARAEAMATHLVTAKIGTMKSPFDDKKFSEVAHQAVEDWWTGKPSKLLGTLNNNQGGGGHNSHRGDPAWGGQFHNWLKANGHPTGADFNLKDKQFRNQLKDKFDSQVWNRNVKKSDGALELAKAAIAGAMPLLKWDESEHLRDEDGRFKDKGGSTLDRFKRIREAKTLEEKNAEVEHLPMKDRVATATVAAVPLFAGLGVSMTDRAPRAIYAAGAKAIQGAAGALKGAGRGAAPKMASPDSKGALVPVGPRIDHQYGIKARISRKIQDAQISARSSLRKIPRVGSVIEGAVSGAIDGVRTPINTRTRRPNPIGALAAVAAPVAAGFYLATGARQLYTAHRIKQLERQEAKASS